MQLVEVYGEDVMSQQCCEMIYGISRGKLLQRTVKVAAEQQQHELLTTMHLWKMTIHNNNEL